MPTRTDAVAVPYGTVADSTGDPAWKPVRVTAKLAEPIVALTTNPLCLDGPLSWAAFTAARRAGARIPPVENDWTIDFALPLATWTAPPSIPDPDPRLLAADGQSAWGWACSVGLYSDPQHTVVATRRRPAVDAMGRFTGDKRHHQSTGSLKARSQASAATIVEQVYWWALADPARLETMLADVPALGRKGRHGHGRVLSWQVTVDDAAVLGWRDRPWPDPAGQPGSIRAPYWHNSRRMPVSTTPGPG